MMWLLIVLVNFLLISFLDSLHPSQSPQSPCPFITAFHPCNLPQNKIQKKNQQNKRNKLSRLTKAILQRVWSGSKPRASAMPSILGPHWDSTWISHLCLVSWRSCSCGSSGSAPSHSPALHRWGECWGELTHRPGSQPGWCWVDRPASFPSLTPTGRALQHCSN